MHSGITRLLAVGGAASVLLLAGACGSSGGSGGGNAAACTRLNTAASQIGDQAPKNSDSPTTVSDYFTNGATQIRDAAKGSDGDVKAAAEKLATAMDTLAAKVKADPVSAGQSTGDFVSDATNLSKVCGAKTP
jgi:hypothetical protein